MGHDPHTTSLWVGPSIVALQLLLNADVLQAPSATQSADDGEDYSFTFHIWRLNEFSAHSGLIAINSTSEFDIISQYIKNVLSTKTHSEFHYQRTLRITLESSLPLQSNYSFSKRPDSFQYEVWGTLRVAFPWAVLNHHNVLQPLIL